MDKLANIKALAFDLDGTLLRSDKTISTRMLAALNRCAERGIRIMLATGRGNRSTEPYRTTVGTPGPHIYYNGAEVRDFSSGGEGDVIHAELLAAAPALFALELARKGNHYFQAYLPSGALVTENLRDEAEYYRVNSGLAPAVTDIQAALSSPETGGVIKCMYITAEQHHAALKSAILERFGGAVTVVRSSPIYLELIANGVSKGAGLVHALAHAGIDPKNAIAFGDEENDLSMFAVAGFSAAPANAAPAVLEAATFRAASNDEDGLAAFLEERVL